jgi:hypothetical protein
MLETISASLAGINSNLEQGLRPDPQRKFSFVYGAFFAKAKFDLAG